MLNQLTHWLKEKQFFLLNGLLALLFADVMVDPNNLIFHAKYILFVLVFLVWLTGRYYTGNKIPVRLGFAVIFIVLFMPFYALSVGIIRSALHNVPVGNLVYFNSFFFFSIALVTTYDQINLTRLFNRSSLLIVFLTLGLYAALVFNPHWFGSLYKYFVLNKGVAVYALRNYGKVTMLMIFYKTSPLLVFPLSYYLYHIITDNSKKSPFSYYLLTALIILTLFLSGTRANVLSLFLILIFYLGFFIYRKSRSWFLLALGLGLLVFLFALPSLWNVIMNRHEASNAIKFGYLSSYADYFSGHLLSLIFGQGIGGEFFAYGLQRFMSASELTYLEVIRIWGIPIAVVFGLVLIWPLVMEIRARKLSHLFVAYLAYLFIAGTNPLLLSSTGMLVLVYVFSMEFGEETSLKAKAQRKK
ncbi:MAG: hypothetical protein IH595_01805 [Bacteroidales bacterium]|nr:hypothetical protein [Bacteroidales bacterium]